MGRGVMCSVKFVVLVAWPPAEVSFSVKVIGKSPLCEGVPLSTPPALNVIPEGNALVVDHVYGEFPPVAASWQP